MMRRALRDHLTPLRGTLRFFTMLLTLSHQKGAWLSSAETAEL